MVIKNISLAHNGGYYFYRMHKSKAEKLCNGFSELKNYLEEMFKNCPHDYFNNGSPRGSSLRFNIPIRLIEIGGHEISSLAKYGLIENKERYKTNHSRVQVFMLERDNKTIAVEVPIWLKKEELDYFTGLFKEEKLLTGHIDIIRIDGNRIWIWDYKPNAKKEKYAITQTYFYALMLSKRTGIDLDNFRCGYFDEKFAFIFKPVKEINIKNSFLDKFL